MIRVPVKIKAKPDCYIAQWPVELVSAMPAPTYDATHPRYFTRLAHVLVPDCQPGDILDCSATVQISNRLGELVEFSAALILTPSSSGVGGLQDPCSVSAPTMPGGKFITRFPGFNVTSNPGGMHHAPFTRQGRYVVPADVSGDQYVAFVAYAAGQTFDPSRTVSVDPWCGDLSVLRFR